MRRDFNKYLNNVLTFQRWNNEQYFYYKVKLENKIKALKIDLNSFRKIKYKKCSN